MAANETSGQSKDDLIIAIFMAAMSLPEEEREPFLRETCRQNSDLFSEVTRRIAWEQKLNGFMLTPVTLPEQLDRPFAVGEMVMKRFQIIRVAGEGGMGVVYEVRDEKLGHRIALKCPRFEYRRRLSPEALSSLRVTHPNVCRVFEIHTVETNSGEVDVLTMEFLEGETLASRLMNAPPRWLETAEGTELARQICAGLQAIHAQGVTHRDLKAGNVMLSTDKSGKARAVIMDFGIAQSGDIFSSQTRGTPAYIAPELWKGQQASAQSDIYALGVILYEMALGYKPFSYKASWKDRLESTPDVPEVREQIRSIILLCLDPDPAKRFQSAAEVGVALGGGRSRRWILGGIGGVLSAGLAATFASERWNPTTPVCLVLLPPWRKFPWNEEILIQGFVEGLSDCLSSLRPVNRPFSVISARQASQDGVNTLDDANEVYGATHGISLEVRRIGEHTSILFELFDSRSKKSLRSFESEAAQSTSLAHALFSAQTNISAIVSGQFALRGKPAPKPLNSETTADFLKGLYYTRVTPVKAAEAIPYFERVIAALHDSPLGHVGMAEALLMVRNVFGDRSQLGKALTALASAEQFDPESPSVQLISGRLNLAEGQYEQALRDFRRAAILSPKEALPYMMMSQALRQLDRPQELEAAFQSAFLVNPGYFRPYLLAAVCYSDLRNFKLAERYFLQAMHLRPQVAHPRLGLADLYLRFGRQAEAAPLVSECLLIRRSAASLELLGDLQFLSGQYAMAATSYEEANRKGVTYTSWARLGAAYRHLNLQSKADHMFVLGFGDAMALFRNRKDSEHVAWSAFYLANLGSMGEARTMAAEALAVPGRLQSNTRKRLILTYGLIHDFDAALRLLKDAPADMLTELQNTPELLPELRRDSRFVSLLPK